MLPLWVIVPFSRRENASLVKANFDRQDYPAKRLCVVENGSAVGSEIDADLVLRSANHQADAKNAGTAYVCKRDPDALVAYFDDDDWYGPEHLVELASIVTVGHAEVAGRLPGFVRLSDGLHLFSWGTPRRHVKWVLGATMVTRARSSVPFRRVPQDDTEWLREMKACVWAGRSRQFVYNRTTATGHVWRTSDALIRRSFGPSLFFGEAPNDIAAIEAPSGGEHRDIPTDSDVFAALNRFHRKDMQCTI